MIDTTLNLSILRAPSHDVTTVTQPGWPLTWLPSFSIRKRIVQPDLVMQQCEGLHLNQYKHMDVSCEGNL